METLLAIFLTLVYFSLAIMLVLFTIMLFVLGLMAIKEFIDEFIN